MSDSKRVACNLVVLAALILGVSRAGAQDETKKKRRRLLAYSSSGFYKDTFGTSKKPPRFLYSNQETVELLLKGNEKTRRRVAALLPLQLGCRMEESRDGYVRPYDDYQLGVLQTIVQEKWQEARPLLPVAFADSEFTLGPFFTDRRRMQAASVWLWLSVQDMTPEQELGFLLRIIEGREPSVRPGMVGELSCAIERAILRLVIGKKERQRSFREQVLSALKRKHNLVSRDDLDRAYLIGSLLASHLWPEESELKSIPDPPTAFNMVVLIQALALDQAARTPRLDALCLNACRNLWQAEGVPVGFQQQIREVAVRTDLLPTLDGADELLLEFLKELDAADDPYAGKGLTWCVITCADRIQHKRPLSEELAKYLVKMASDPRYQARSIRITPGVDVMPHERELRDTYDTYMSARHFLDPLLKAMKHPGKGE